MLTASCHCGAVRLQVPSVPAHLISCNCSICRRYGALWALYESSVVAVSGRDSLAAYVWGKRTIRTMRCAICGCVTHWEPLDADAGQRFGVNMRNVDPALIDGVEVRRFDGADTWTYLDADTVPVDSRFSQ